MAETAIAEQQFAANPPEELPKIVRLALAELRRRRHSSTIRGLCANEEQGKAFLFEFALARKAIRPIHEDVPLCIRQSERGDKFRAALQNSSEIGIMPASAVAIDVSKPQGVGVHRVMSSSPRARSVPMEVNQVMQPVKRAETSPMLLCTEAIDDEQIADAVAQWFTTKVNPGLWEDVRTEAQFQVIRYLNCPPPASR